VILILFPFLLGGAIGVLMALRIGALKNNGFFIQNLFFQFIYGLCVYGLPLYFVFLSSETFPVQTVSAGFTLGTVAYARRYSDLNNPSIPRIMRNPVFYLAISLAAIANVVLFFYCVYLMFSQFAYYGIAHLITALFLGNMLKNGYVPFPINFVGKSVVAPFLSAIVFTYLAFQFLI
jgi:hypothetical protein